MIAGTIRRTNLETDTAGAVARRVVDLDTVVAEQDVGAVIEPVDWRRLPDVDAEHHSLLDGPLVEKQVVAMQVHGRGERFRGRRDAGDMVDVGVCEQDVAHLQGVRRNRRQQLFDLVSRIDEDRLARAGAPDDESVLHERRNGTDFEDHTGMVLCVLDDLLFSVKISTAGKALGVELYFERSADKVVGSIRDRQPALVILDLDSRKLQPIEAIRAIKADAALRTIPTLGYVSHVHADTIAAARAAGVDEVLARSAFSEQLGAILTRGA